MLTINLVYRHTTIHTTTANIPANFNPRDFFGTDEYLYMGIYYGQLANQFKTKMCPEPNPPPPVQSSPSFSLLTAPTIAASAMDPFIIGCLTFSQAINRLRAVNNL
ncbi:hypothetical protein BSKO_10233 [Bryopsis sp. KO-2023]|nr:hypothetical protein BSKO_10233 [Bryopsis sp. KO-2023]